MPRRIPATRISPPRMTGISRASAMNTPTTLCRCFRQMLAAVSIGNAYVYVLDLDYSAVGTLRYITRAGDIVDDSPLLRFQRYASLAQLMVTGGFEEIAKDHRGACGGGYMGAVCPQGVCP